MQAAYHETFDADDPVPVGSFVPVVDELRELRDIMPYKNLKKKRVTAADAAARYKFSLFFIADYKFTMQLKSTEILGRVVVVPA